MIELGKYEDAHLVDGNLVDAALNKQYLPIGKVQEITPLSSF